MIVGRPYTMPNYQIQMVSEALNKGREDAVESIWSIAVQANMVNDTLEAKVIHNDGYSHTLEGSSISELAEKVGNYLDPWRQYQEAE